jgi:hypothetical protein
MSAVTVMIFTAGWGDVLARKITGTDRRFCGFYFYFETVEKKKEKVNASINQKSIDRQKSLGTRQQKHSYSSCLKSVIT